MLQADPRDLVISQLAVKLLLTDARADEAEAKVAQLEQQVRDLQEQLAHKPENGKVPVD